MAENITREALAVLLFMRDPARVHGNVAEGDVQESVGGRTDMERRRKRRARIARLLRVLGMQIAPPAKIEARRPSLTAPTL